ncbi:hypothetical protein [Halobacteriaceae bacterium SHR40]|uniref:hypothetical protein n=1 Tax=Halovenus amylolytica TaxID=2500550 RepID=UPI000FE4089C
MEMRDIDHTHPHTGESFGTQYYDAGAVAADGGREAAEKADEDAEQTTETMADVDHDASEGTVRSFQRGSDGRESSVEHE